jgi:hypothetical protein
MPEVTEAGISIRCLLNSALRLGGLVKIDTGLLSGVPYTPGGENSISGLSSGGTSPTQTTSTSGDNNPLRNTILNSAATSPQGVYKILLLTHSGDTRENPWYSDMVCIAFDETTGKILSIPNDATFRGFQDENSAAQGSARPGQ